MIKKGILKVWDSGTYKATVQITGDLISWLEGVRVSRSIPSVEMVVGRNVVLAVLDPSNPNDCVVVGIWGPGPGGGGETGSSILEKLQKHLGVWWFNNNWLPAGMVSNGISGSGSFEWFSDAVRNRTGTTSASYAQLKKIARGLSYAYSWDKKRLFGVYVYFGSYSAQNIHIVSGQCPTTGAANTNYHIGFKLINGTLYGTVADGTTESVLQIETLTAAAFRRLECVLTPGTECRFYVDGVDKGAITTNLPTGTLKSFYMLYSTVHNTEAADKYFDFYEARTFQEE